MSDKKLTGICPKCGFELYEDDDVDMDGYTYIGGSKFIACPNYEEEDDGHTFERF